MKTEHWVVSCRHSYGSDAKRHVVHSKDEAAAISHKFFLGYFELKDGKPFDPGNDDGSTGGFDVFDEVKMLKGKVLEFSHFGGEGPSCDVTKARK